TKEVWADGNIYLEEPGQQINFTGGNLYAADETKTVTIKGNVNFQRPDITIKAERCSFNWKTKIAEFDNLVEVTKDGKVDVYDVVHY
ncbi:Organic solvent tolerance protein OstA, partial [Fusobacterium mortiferum]|nr:Organic solvent tolerance protein OstA [Fusobacterium mortiferum]